MKPTIPLGKKFWPLSPEEKAEIERIFATEEVRRLVTSLRSRKDTAAVEVLDRDAVHSVACASRCCLELAKITARTAASA
jgi:hypothetical protein